MSAPPKELFANQASTTLNGAINNSVTSVVVTDGSVFPATGNFRVLCGSELMLVTARSSNTLTVERGIEGTSNNSHANTDPIALNLTTGGIDQWLKDSVPLAGYHKPLGIISNDAGTALLNAASFTGVNMSTSTVTDQSGTILLRAIAASGNNCRIQELTAPSTPFTYNAAFHFCGLRGGSDDNVFLLFGFRESSTSKLSMILFGTFSDEANVLAVQNYTNSTTFASSIRATQCFGLIGSEMWLRIEDDATNLKFYASGDGENWMTLGSVGRTSHMAGGPNRIFYGVLNGNNTVNEALGRLIHWSKE